MLYFKKNINFLDEKILMGSIIVHLIKDNMAFHRMR